MQPQTEQRLTPSQIQTRLPGLGAIGRELGVHMSVHGPFSGTALIIDIVRKDPRYRKGNRARDAVAYLVEMGILVSHGQRVYYDAARAKTINECRERKVHAPLADSPTVRARAIEQQLKDAAAQRACVEEDLREKARVAAEAREKQAAIDTETAVVFTAPEPVVIPAGETPEPSSASGAKQAPAAVRVRSYIKSPPPNPSAAARYVLYLTPHEQAVWEYLAEASGETLDGLDRDVLERFRSAGFLDVDSRLTSQSRDAYYTYPIPERPTWEVPQTYLDVIRGIQRTDFWEAARTGKLQSVLYNLVATILPGVSPSTFYVKCVSCRLQRNTDGWGIILPVDWHGQRVSRVLMSVAGFERLVFVVKAKAKHHLQSKRVGTATGAHVSKGLIASVVPSVVEPAPASVVEQIDGLLDLTALSDEALDAQLAPLLAEKQRRLSRDEQQLERMIAKLSEDQAKKRTEREALGRLVRNKPEAV